jgi:hypothetical protein
MRAALTPIAAWRSCRRTEVLTMVTKVGVTLAVALLLGGQLVDAEVLCQTRNGTLKVRETACRKKRKEKAVDPVGLGLQGPQGPQGPKGASGSPGVTAVAGHIEVADGGNGDVLDVPGFGRIVVQSGGCVTGVSVQAIAVAFVNTTGSVQDVFTFSFNPQQGPDAGSGYAMAAPGVETGLRQLGATGFIIARVRQRVGTGQATLVVHGAAGGLVGDVCAVSAQAFVTSS